MSTQAAVANWLGWTGEGHAVTTPTRRGAHVFLIALIACIFLVDLAYLPLQEQADTLFQPIYRVRQTLGVAISRLQDPPAAGYTAHASVIESLNLSGFAVFESDPGPPFDNDRSNALLTNGDRIDAAMRAAQAAPVDTTRDPELILGNELAYADFFSLSFALFGVNIASLYYLTFLLLGVSVLLFVLEYRRNPTMLVTLAIYLSSILFLHGFARAAEEQFHVIQNSRGFDALSLLAAFHLIAAACRGGPLTAGRVLGLVGQAVIFAFLLASRSTILWQLAFMAVTGVLLTLWVLFRTARAGKIVRLLRHGVPLLLPMIAVVGYLAAINAARSDAYDGQPNTHVIWHNILVGVLDSAPDIEKLYLGTADGVGDQIAYDAVMAHLNRIDDSSSPVAFRHEGRIYIQPQWAWSDYDELAKDVVFEIATQYPIAIVEGAWNKLSLQSAWFFMRGKATAVLPLAGSALFAALALTAGALAGGFAMGNRPVAAGALAITFVLFSMVPALIMPAPINVGTLLTWIASSLLGLAFAVRAGAHLLSRSLPSQSSA